MQQEDDRLRRAVELLKRITEAVRLQGESKTQDECHELYFDLQDALADANIFLGDLSLRR